MPLPSLPFGNLIASRQLVSGNTINRIHDLLTSFLGGPSAGITALAGGARSVLTPVLNAAFCEITVAATAADSVQLPVAKVGLSVTVTNNGASSAQVFAYYTTTDTIQGTAGATGVALAAGATARYQCTKDGVWKRFVSA